MYRRSMRARQVGESCYNLVVPRLFLALDLPDEVDMDIQMMSGGIPGARWQKPEQLHLTLHFLGEVDGGVMRRLIAALGQLEAPAFELGLRGAGVFPPRGQPRVIWLGVDPPEPVRVLHQRSARILDELGLERERRKFSPHVTVARLRKEARAEQVGSWVQGHALYRSARFMVDHVRLYSSITAARGAKYTCEAMFELEPAEDS